MPALNRVKLRKPKGDNQTFMQNTFWNSPKMGTSLVFSVGFDVMFAVGNCVKITVCIGVKLSVRTGVKPFSNVHLQLSVRNSHCQVEMANHITHVSNV